MITLNFGTKTFSLICEEATFVAKNLSTATSGRLATASAFTSGMHSKISVISKKAKPAKQCQKKENREFRSNSPQSDQVLTDC